MKFVWAIALSALFAFTIMSADDSFAMKSSGVSQTKTMSNNICGLEMCDSPDQIDKKISNYLSDIQKSSLENFNYEQIDNAAYITKKSLVSNNLILLHYSDGNWELIEKTGFLEGLKQSQNESGQSQMEFGGTIDLGDTSTQKTVGRLDVTETSISRPYNEKPREVKIYGDVGKKSLPNVLLTIEYPDKSIQDFIMSVSETGTFEAGLNVDKNTQIGTYLVTAKYASKLLGQVTFDVVKQDVASKSVEKFDSIKLSTNRLSIPSSNAQSFIIQVTGSLADFHKGNMVELILESSNGIEFTRKIPATSDGTFSTFLNITPDFPEGTSTLIMKYLGKEVSKATIVANPGTLTLK